MKKILKFFVQHYLRLLAKIVLWRHKPMVVAISGTTNKTFIKELILKELGNDLSVRGNPKSFNTEIGLPLAVLFLRSGYCSVLRWADILFEGTAVALFSRKFPKVLVLELGVDCKGDMKYLLTIVRPIMAIITNVDRSFPNNNTSVDDVVEEMKQLVESVKESGVVLLNGDDDRVKALKKNCKAETITWGSCSDCDVRISKVEPTDAGQIFELKNKEKSGKIEIRKFGYHNVSATVAAKIATEQILKRKK